MANIVYRVRKTVRILRVQHEISIGPGEMVAAVVRGLALLPDGARFVKADHPLDRDETIELTFLEETEQ